MDTIEINLRIYPRSLTLDQFEKLVSKASRQGITSDEFVLNAIIEKIDSTDAAPDGGLPEFTGLAGAKGGRQ